MKEDYFSLTRPAFGSQSDIDDDWWTNSLDGLILSLQHMYPLSDSRVFCSLIERVFADKGMENPPVVVTTELIRDRLVQLHAEGKAFRPKVLKSVT